MLMQVTELDGVQFSRQGSKLVAEASEVRFHRCERLWDDACDVGIAIRGARHVVRFALSRTDSRDGETRAWEFKPATDLDARHANGITDVVIFND